jgi:hypothetical protein
MPDSVRPPSSLVRPDFGIRHPFCSEKMTYKSPYLEKDNLVVFCHFLVTEIWPDKR